MRISNIRNNFGKAKEKLKARVGVGGATAASSEKNPSRRQSQITSSPGSPEGSLRRFNSTRAVADYDTGLRHRESLLPTAQLMEFKESIAAQREKAPSLDSKITRNMMVKLAQHTAFVSAAEKDIAEEYELKYPHPTHDEMRAFLTHVKDSILKGEEPHEGIQYTFVNYLKDHPDILESVRSRLPDMHESVRNKIIDKDILKLAPALGYDQSSRSDSHSSLYSTASDSTGSSTSHRSFDQGSKIAEPASKAPTPQAQSSLESLGGPSSPSPLAIDPSLGNRALSSGDSQSSLSSSGSLSGERQSTDPSNQVAAETQAKTIYPTRGPVSGHSIGSELSSASRSTGFHANPGARKQNPAKIPRAIAFSPTLEAAGKLLPTQQTGHKDGSAGGYRGFDHFGGDPFPDDPQTQQTPASRQEPSKSDESIGSAVSE
jgi:hypothetical protein